MALNAVIALTSRAAVKEYLRIKPANLTEDDFIDNLINRASKKFESRTKRKLKERTLTEEYDGTGTKDLVLHEYPIKSVIDVFIDFRRDFTSDTRLDDEDVVVSAAEGRITIGTHLASRAAIGGIFSRGTKIIRVKYIAGLDPIPEDLEGAAIQLAAANFARAREGADAILVESAGGRTITWKDGMPTHIIDTVDDYRRRG